MSHVPGLVPPIPENPCLGYTYCDQITIILMTYNVDICKRCKYVVHINGIKRWNIPVYNAYDIHTIYTYIVHIITVGSI